MLEPHREGLALRPQLIIAARAPQAEVRAFRPAERVQTPSQGKGKTWKWGLDELKGSQKGARPGAVLPPKGKQKGRG